MILVFWNMPSMFTCFLHSLKNTHKPISLPHLQEIFVGRSIETGITDPNCSRRQISIKADCNKKIAHVKQLGVNQSGINGFSIFKDESLAVEDGTNIELLLNDHVEEIRFSEISESSESVSNHESPPRASLKRSRDDESCSARKEAKMIVDAPEPELSIDDISKRKGLKPTSEDQLEKIDNGLLYIFTSKGVLSSSKIAAYDIDGTIIKTKSGLVFPKSTDDWQLAFPEVPTKLKKFVSLGYKIVFFTNQAGIGNGKLKIADFRTKIENVLRRIGVPCQTFISSGKGIYRKPAMGMWDTLKQMKNDDLEIDMKSSFYCGDAAGRKKDHSLADRLFAENIGLPFETPEHHFGGSSEAPYNQPSFDPKLIDTNVCNADLLSDKQEILILVGLPGSGKSHFSKGLAHSSKGRYSAVCRDQLGAWQKCITEATKLIKKGKSVIADSTNPDKESRGRWVSLARSSGVACRCLLMDLPLAHALHNNRFRQLTDTTHAYVADMVFHSYRKKFEEPTTAEGFSHVLKFRFIPEFDSDAHKELYFKHLLEK